ncbi:MAG: Stk1 family PASTA domain-containing Ser/Thr kinase [Bifidobacteriaceae bacterium]|nr:Stk1 family PASTA domain-containing Ser/Thr kinase [Bifidobacteriaceae bacterium]
MADLTPRILAGRYEVGELIGRGGMAEVHVGRDTRLGRTVAIKLLRSDLARDPSFQTRFRREAQAAASLNHPAIVSVYDTGEDVVTDTQGVTHHVPFIIMEYVEGHTLRELMRDGAALPIDEAVDVTIGVLSALQYAHHAGIVHRDIKPGNIMLTAAGQVKVMDFGIARALAETSDAVTQTQAVIGTAQYLSPEQARGETVDARSDLYSTGCVLFELLTGRPPFVGDSAVAVAYQHVREQPVPPSAFAPDVPAALDQIVMRALVKNRDLRYSTASEFLADLQAFKQGTRISQPPPVAAPSVQAEATQVLPPPVTAYSSYAPPSPPVGASFQNAGILPPSSLVEEEEQAAEAKRKRLVIIWATVGAVVGVALLVTLILLLTNRGEPAQEPTSPPTTQAAPVTVPPVPDSRSVADAVAVLDQAKLTAAEGVGERSDLYPAGQVIRFEPASGDTVDEGATVKYIVSLGANISRVPPTEGMTQDQAEAALLAANLKFDGVVPENHPTIALGKVIGTDPAVDQELPVGSDVKVIISNGKTTVPVCKGKTQSECSNELNAAGLVPSGATFEESDEPPDTVIRTDPAAGVTVDQKAPVSIVVAKAVPVVKLEDFTGKSASEARGWITGANLKYAEVEETSATVPAGQVIRTEPPAGEEVKVGDTVTVHVSTGPADPQPSASATE